MIMTSIDGNSQNVKTPTHKTDSVLCGGNSIVLNFLILSGFPCVKTYSLVLIHCPSVVVVYTSSIWFLNFSCFSGPVSHTFKMVRYT